MPAIMQPKHGFEYFGPGSWSDFWWILAGVILALLLFPFGS